ncbi:MAG TPA: hypothetical protein VKW78_03165 [Terriglobales bacterium]|nr:hypothetical protein [Terriglobales bacterium]
MGKLLWLAMAGLCLIRTAALAEDKHDNFAATFHSTSDLVLVDVVALDPRNGLSNETLTRQDFQLFDNDRPVAIKTFDTGSSARSLSLWFVVQCSMKGWETRGSGLFAGQASRLEPALRDLTKQDTVAVAHWCDNGDAALDLLPTHNVERGSSELEQALASGPNATQTNRPGELALQRTLQLIIDNSLATKPEPLPVLIFLYGDYSGMPKGEANHFINELLETSAIAFGLRDTRSPRIHFLLDEQKEVAHYIAAQTGGEYLDVTPDTYASGLQEILRQLHFRYELGFKPEVLDGKRHKLRVELAEPAKQKYKQLRLRYRAAYVPVAGGM